MTNVTNIETKNTEPEDNFQAGLVEATAYLIRESYKNGYSETADQLLKALSLALQQR